MGHRSAGKLPARWSNDIVKREGRVYVQQRPVHTRLKMM